VETPQDQTAARTSITDQRSVRVRIKYATVVYRFSRARAPKVTVLNLVLSRPLRM